MEELRKLVAGEGEGQWGAKAERFFEVTGRSRTADALRHRWRGFGKAEAEREPEKQRQVQRVTQSPEQQGSSWADDPQGQPAQAATERQPQPRSQQHAASAGHEQSKAPGQEPSKPRDRPRRGAGQFFCVECNARNKYLFGLEAECQDASCRPSRLLCSGSANPCLPWPRRYLSADGALAGTQVHDGGHSARRIPRR